MNNIKPLNVSVEVQVQFQDSTIPTACKCNTTAKDTVTTTPSPESDRMERSANNNSMGDTYIFESGSNPQIIVNLTGELPSSSKEPKTNKNFKSEESTEKKVEDKKASDKDISPTSSRKERLAENRRERLKNQEKRRQENAKESERNGGTNKLTNKAEAKDGDTKPASGSPRSAESLLRDISARSQSFNLNVSMANNSSLPLKERETMAKRAAQDFKDVIQDRISLANLQTGTNKDPEATYIQVVRILLGLQGEQLNASEVTITDQQLRATALSKQQVGPMVAYSIAKTGGVTVKQADQTSTKSSSSVGSKTPSSTDNIQLTDLIKNIFNADLKIKSITVEF